MYIFCQKVQRQLSEEISADVQLTNIFTYTVVMILGPNFHSNLKRKLAKIISSIRWDVYLAYSRIPKVDPLNFSI